MVSAAYIVLVQCVLVWHSFATEINHKSTLPGTGQCGEEGSTCQSKTEPEGMDIEPVKLSKELRNGDVPMPILDEAKLGGMKSQLLLLTHGYQVSVSLHAVCALDIPTVLGLKGKPLTAIEIAEEVRARGGDVNINTDALEITMRLLSQFDVFEESPGPRFGISDLSQLLRTDAKQLSFRSRTLTLTRPDLYTAFGHLPHLIAYKGDEDVDAGNCPHALAHGAAMWDHMNRRPPWVLEHFNGMMSGSSAVTSVIKSWDGWAKFPAGTTVVDVGGNDGALSKALKQSLPELEFINFDRTAVISQAREIPGVTHVNGSFFENIIPKSDVAIMKHVLHNWDDKRCEQIISNVAEALPNGGTLLIFEVLLLEPGERDPTRRSDFNFHAQMFTSFGGKERTLEGFKLMLGAKGFTVNSVGPWSPLISGGQLFTAELHRP